jgi:hypothetical protein
VTITGAGTIYLMATQAASGNYAAGSATTSFTVAQEVPTLSFNSIPAETYGNAPFTVSTTSPSIGTVTFSLTPGQTSAGSVSSTGTVTISGAGTIYLTATQTASGNYAAGTATTSITVAPGSVNLSFTSVPLNKTYGNAAFTVVASNATGPVSNGAITYLVSGGPATVGSTTGLVTLTNSGTVNLQASQAASGNYAAASANASFTVYPTLTLTATTLSTGAVGAAYNQSLVSLASGGNGSVNYSWSTNAAGVTNLAALGLTLNSTGTITGTPAKGQTGTETFLATVSDTAGNSSQAQMQVTVNASLTVSTTTLPNGFTGPGASYLQQLIAVGGSGSYTSWAVTSGGTQLAALGLSLNTGTGVISNGSATLIPGSATITVKVTDSNGATALSSPLTINIYAPLALPTPGASVPAEAIFGQSYAASINVTGGSGNYSWQITNIAQLTSAGFTPSPSGSPFTGSTFSISATKVPTTAQNISFSVTVTDTTTSKIVGPITYNLVAGPPTPLSLQPTSGSALTGALTSVSYTNSLIWVSNGSGSGYAFAVTGVGVTALTTTSWTLPDGLAASTSNSNVLTISGTPNATTPITLSVTATDGAGDSVGPYSYTLAVTTPAPLALPAAGPLTAATIGQTYSNSISVTGGDQKSFVWTVNGTAVSTSGSALAIADGISVTNTGGSTLSINGPATTYGTVTLNVTVSDVGTGQSISTPVQYTIACNPPTPLALTPSPNPLPSGTYNPSGISSYSGASINAKGGIGSGYVFSVNVNGTTTVVGAATTVPIGDGLSVSASGGTLTISGMPTQSGDVPLNVTLNDGVGDPAVTQSYVIALVNPAKGYTVSGNISYSGTKTGWTYIQLNNGLGTAISEANLTAGGTFTIHGVTPGTYNVTAFMDTLGNGSWNAADPSGTSGASVTVSTANVSGAYDTLIDPTGLTLTSAPTWDSSQGWGAFSGGAFISFDTIMSNDVEQAAGYTVQWSTSLSFGTGTESQCFPATGSSNPWIVTGISGSGPYYFRAAGILGSCATPTSTGPWSAASPAMTIVAPTGNAVSGTVTIPSTVTPTGPLYVGFYNQSTGQVYATEITNPSNSTPNAYSVNVPTGSNYFLFGILDQNKTGVLNAPGEISNTNTQNMTTAAIDGTTTNDNLDLTPYAANAQATVRTQNTQTTDLNGVTTDNYSLGFRVQGLVKLPVSVEIATDSATGVIIPADIATGAFNGNSDQFKYWPNLNGDIPAQGDTYKLNVTYSDGTSNSTANNPANPLILTVGAPLNAFATNLAPSGTGVSVLPDFSWNYLTGASSSDTYSFQLWTNSGSRIWKIPSENSNSNGFPSTISPAITYGVDPTGTGDLPSIPILSSGSTYWWSIQASDANGDEATTQVAFQTQGTPLSLPTTDPSSLSTTTVSGQWYYGSISVVGGIAPYNWSVNWNSSNDNLNWSTTNDGSSLVISGVPSQTGTVTFQAEVSDSNGVSSGWQTYTINVIAGNINYYPVYGQINFNGCGTDEPPVTLTLSGGGITQTAVSDSTGMYQFASVSNGTYTITPSITGPTSSSFSPASLPLTVNSSYVNGNNFSATVGYTVSGTVGYDGAKSGPIYLAMNGCGSPTPGTAIVAPGTFTIHGVPPGVYYLQAWMDNLGKGAQNLSNPLGRTSSVVVPNANNANLTIGLTDPTPATLSNASGIASANGFADGAVLTFSPDYEQNALGNWVEDATSYTVQWSTTQNFSSVAGSANFPASGWAPGYWILNAASVSGLTQGSTYYFRVQGVAGSSTSNWSSVIGPVTISAPTATNTVTGQITFSQKATGPLYVGFLNQNTGQVYLTQVGSQAAPPASPASYSLQVPSGSNYFFFAALDQNNDGLIDSGDITNVNGYNKIVPAVNISGAATENLTLPSGNSNAVVRTQNLYHSGQSYNLFLDVTSVGKLPIAVELTSAPAGSNIVAPADIAWCFSCSSEDVFSSFNPSYGFGSTAPTVGSSYGLKISYPDRTSDTAAPQVTAVVPTWTANLSPAGPLTAINNSPDFTWTYPTGASNYLYNFWLGNSSWNTIWSIPNQYSGSNDFTSTLSSSLTLAGSDPTDPSNKPTISALTTGALYYWDVQSFDTHGNYATYIVDLISGYTALALPAVNPSSLGSAYLNQNYTGSITASGGYGGYSYSVNAEYNMNYSNVSIGNGLHASSNNGVLTISGTPNATGAVSFSVYVVDSTWSTYVGPVTYTININQYANVSLPGGSQLGTAFVNTAYSATISASGGAGGNNYMWTVNGQAITDYGTVTLLNQNGLTATNKGNNELSIGGTPTAVESASLDVVVTDTFNTSGTTATATYTLPVITGPNGANNKYLSGTYVCKFDGFQDSDGARWSSLASFQADGENVNGFGLFSSGVWDMARHSVNSPSSPMSGWLNGTYTIGSDGNGLLTMSSTVTTGGSGVRSTSYAIALNNTASATTATEFRLIETDDVGTNPSGQHGAGVCYQAISAAFAVNTANSFVSSTTTGNSFVYGMQGEDESGLPEAIAGRSELSLETATGGTGGAPGGVSLGEVNDHFYIKKTSNQGVSCTSSCGTYTAPDAYGRMTNSSSVVVQGVSYTSSNVVYIIDANRAFIMTTSGDGGVQSGDARKQQQGSTSANNSAANLLNSNFVLYTQEYKYSNGGVSGYDSMVLQGTGDGAGNITVNQSYNDSEGTYKVGNENGGPIAVTFDAANPGRATFSPEGGTFYLYFFNNNSAFEVDFNGSNGNLETGWMESQTQSTFTNAKLGGDYLTGPLPLMSAAQNVQIGEVNLSTTSSSAFTGELTEGGAGVFSFDQPFSGPTYAWDTTTTAKGTFLIPLAGMSCAVINPTEAVCTNQTGFPAITILQQ